MKRILARLSEKDKSKEDSSINRNSRDVQMKTDNSFSVKSEYTSRMEKEKITIESKSSKPRGNFKETFQPKLNKAENLQQSISKVDINKNLKRKKTTKENSKVDFPEKNDVAIKSKQPDKKGILDFANKRSSLFSAVPLSRMVKLNYINFPNFFLENT
jgi:hypothetical protein